MPLPYLNIPPFCSARSESPSSFLPDDASSVAESESFKAVSSVGVPEEDWAGSDISVGEADRTPLSTCMLGGRCVGGGDISVGRCCYIHMLNGVRK